MKAEQAFVALGEDCPYCRFKLRSVFIGLRFCFYEFEQWSKGPVLFRGNKSILCLEGSSDVF